MGLQQDFSRAAPVDAQQGPPSAVSVEDRGEIERTVKSLIRDRRNRDAHFMPELFSDPAWEILLALTLAESRYHRLFVSQLCERVAAPTTTAMRWINILTEKGILLRRDDVNDKRRKYIELSPAAFAKMAAYCARPRDV